MSKNFETRFWQKVIKTEGCWKWTGGRHTFGYGMIRDDHRKKMTASRASWVIHFGEPPPKMHICHKCDNPECTNPNHLFLGTAQDNARDMVEKERGTRRFSQEESDTIKTLHELGVSLHGLARAYKADRKSIKTAIENGDLIPTPKKWAPDRPPLPKSPPPVFRGSENHKAKISEADVLEIRRLRQQGLSTGDIAKLFPIGKSMVSHICTRRCWAHI